MHLNCPNCQAEIEVIPEESVAFLTCSTCGSRINPSTLIDVEQTASFVPQPKRMIDEYELIELIGRGTFGEVWKARDTLLKTLVAIKLPREHNFHADAQELFLREARTMATLKHPNIVRVLRVINRPDLTAIVQDYIPGTSLAERLKNFPFEDPRSAVAFWEVVARAVEFANEAGVVHRDLKTANILLNEKLEPLVTDFGLAKANSAEFTVTERNDVVGNYAHMSPEQAAGRSRDATRRSDVYSLGSILYQLLAHRFPFMGEGSTMSHLKQTADPKPPSAFKPGIPRDLDTICLKALRRDPAERYATAAEFADDLRRWLDGRPIQARPTPAWERAWRWTKRNRALTGMGVLVGVVIMLAAGIVYWMMPDDGKIRVSIPIVIRQGDSSGQLLPITDSSILMPAPGAQVKLWARRSTDGRIVPDSSPQMIIAGSDGIARVRVLPGNYFVVANVTGHGFHEVERLVPHSVDAHRSAHRHQRWKKLSETSIELPRIAVPPSDLANKSMKLIEGNSNTTLGEPGNAFNPEHVTVVRSFFLDVTEVSVRQWIQCQFKPNTKSQTPSDMPITGISHDEATAFAEHVGKRLPFEEEYEFAARNGGNTNYPTGSNTNSIDERRWIISPVGSYGDDETRDGIRGLFSNVLEFTSSWYSINSDVVGRVSPESSILIGSHRVVRGGPAEILNGPIREASRETTPAERVPFETFRASRAIGIRCARSYRAHLDTPPGL
jgi:hypothetical protein